MIWTLLGPSPRLSCLPCSSAVGWAVAHPLGFQLIFPEGPALFLLLPGKQNPLQLLLRFALPVRAFWSLFPESWSREVKKSMLWSEKVCAKERQIAALKLSLTSACRLMLMRPWLYQLCLSACQALPI